MKNPKIILSIYIIALVLSFIGWYIDTDVTTNTLAYQMFEVFILSLFVFGILLLIGFLFYSLYVSVKVLFNR